jgi:hypothetical protein
VTLVMLTGDNEIEETAELSDPSTRHLRSGSGDCRGSCVSG